MKKQKGITLVALVVTIIILLILAGISIASLTGSGLFENAKEAREKYKNSQEYEEAQLAKYANDIDTYVGSNRASIEKTVLFEGTAGTAGNTYAIKDISKYEYLYVIAQCTSKDSSPAKITMLIDVDDIEYGSYREFLISSFLHSTANWSIGFGFKDNQTLYISDINNGSGWPNSGQYAVSQGITKIIGIK